jgi:hypothetical protein
MVLRRSIIARNEAERTVLMDGWVYRPYLSCRSMKEIFKEIEGIACAIAGMPPPCAALFASACGV